VRAAVRIVLQALDLGRDTVLVALEVDDPVMLLVPAAVMARGDVAVVVAAGLARLCVEQRVDRAPLVQTGRDDLDVAAPAGGGGFELYECHRDRPL
jgi:hypothetical protein